MTADSLPEGGMNIHSSDFLYRGFKYTPKYS